METAGVPTNVHHNIQKGSDFLLHLIVTRSSRKSKNYFFSFHVTTWISKERGPNLLKLFLLIFINIFHRILIKNKKQLQEKKSLKDCFTHQVEKVGNSDFHLKQFFTAIRVWKSYCFKSLVNFWCLVKKQQPIAVHVPLNQC